MEWRYVPFKHQCGEAEKRCVKKAGRIDIPLNFFAQFLKVLVLPGEEKEAKPTIFDNSQWPAQSTSPRVSIPSRGLKLVINSP